MSLFLLLTIYHNEDNYRRPKTAVTVLMLSSVGANSVLAIKSQNRQKTPPPRKHPGIIRIGFDVRKRFFTKWGAAIPTKDTGPAKAVMQADKMLDKTTKATRNRRMLIPIFCA